MPQYTISSTGYRSAGLMSQLGPLSFILFAVAVILLITFNILTFGGQIGVLPPEMWSEVSPSHCFAYWISPWGISSVTHESVRVLKVYWCKFASWCFRSVLIKSGVICTIKLCHILIIKHSGSVFVLALYCSTFDLKHWLWILKAGCQLLK